MRLTDGQTGPPSVHCDLEGLLERAAITVQELTERTGISRANLSTLKNNRAKAVRFTTALAICEALNCDFGDLFTIRRATA